MKVKNIGLLFAVTAGLVFAAPRPSLAPGPDIWTLDVVYTQPQQYAVENPRGETEIYWYMILTLTNTTGRDVPFYPKFELMTDTWQTVVSDTGITSVVYDKLKKMNQGSFPFLITMDEIDNFILQGEDNAVDILVVWKDFDPEAKGVKFFYAGLSNETAVVEIERQNCVEKYYLRKTLELSYLIPGDQKKRLSQTLVFTDKNWIMR